MAGRRWPLNRRIGLAFGLWLVVASVFIAENVVNATMAGRPVRWALDVWGELTYWLVWVLLTPLLFFLARRFPFEPPRLGRNVVVHAAASLGIAPLQAFAATLIQLALAHEPWTAAARHGVLVWTVSLTGTAVWKYWVILGVYQAFTYATKYHERTLAAARLERELAGAELHRLQAQLRPHFLFNTLHTASMLALLEPAAAQRVLVRLSQLLRKTLSDSVRLEVPLSEELDFVQGYLEIEATRFRDRLTVTYDWDETARQAWVPAFSLQVLVENAIRHGIAPSSRAGRLVVRAGITSNQLVCEVEDDGPGLPSEFAIGQADGIGLRNLAARLSGLYGSQAELELASIHPHGTVARLRVPMRYHPSDVDRAA